MAVTGNGFDGTMTETAWSELHELIADQTVNGLLVTATTGTRTVSVASGSAVAAGVLVKNTAAVPLTLATNGTTNSRIDVIVATINWAGTGGTVTFAVIQGTAAATPIVPGLTQTPGTLWHLPLAYVTVAAGAGQLADTAVEDVRPGKRQRPIVYKSAITIVSLSQSAAPRQVARIAVPDPGWRYRLELSGAVEFARLSSGGRGNVAVTVDGEEIVTGRGSTNNEGTAVLRTEWTGLKNGKSVVSMTVSPAGLSAVETLTTQAGFSGLTAVVHPA